jgi:hypothetical protein
MKNQLKFCQCMKIFIALFLQLLIPLFIKAEETNEVYVIDDPVGIVFIGENAAKVHHAELVQQAQKIKTRESLPAKDFPEGNWGEVTNGFQLSLRFNKTAYTNGESIETILLLRNVTNQVIQLGYSKLLDSLDGPAKFQILSDTGQVIPEHYYSPIPNWLPGANVDKSPQPGTQRRYVEHLDGEYHLTNGTYSVCASISMSYYGSPITQVKSAPVTIKIEDSPSK